MTNKSSEHEITDEVLQAATSNPNGWVYKIDGAFGPDEDVPPEAVVGAWKVDASGNLTGEFIVNPTYQRQLNAESTGSENTGSASNEILTPLHDK